MPCVRGRMSSHATVVAYLALFAALGGSSYAALKVRGSNVVNSSLTGKDVKRNSLTGADVKSLGSADVTDGALRNKDFRAGELPAGAPGAPGPAGPIGPAGPTGPTGPAGSPDAPSDVLGKLAGVDGSGSGLDADFVDGVGASALQRGTGDVVAGAAETSAAEGNLEEAPIAEVPGGILVSSNCDNDATNRGGFKLQNLTDEQMLLIYDNDVTDPVALGLGAGNVAATTVDDVPMVMTAQVDAGDFHATVIGSFRGAGADPFVCTHRAMIITAQAP